MNMKKNLFLAKSYLEVSVDLKEIVYNVVSSVQTKPTDVIVNN